MGVTGQHEVLMFGQYTHAPAQGGEYVYITLLAYCTPRLKGGGFGMGGDKGYLIDTSINWYVSSLG